MLTNDWHVNRLEVRNFRLMAHLEIDFGRSVTLLVGANGSGKSSVLDALAIMLSTPVVELGGEARNFSPSDARRTLSNLNSDTAVATDEPQYPIVGKIGAVLSGGNYLWTRRLSGENGRTTRGDRDVRQHVNEIRRRSTQVHEVGSSQQTLPALAYYGTERLHSTRRDQSSIPPSRTGAYYSALDPRSDLSRLSTFLEALESEVLAAYSYGEPAPEAARNQLSAIREACSSILEPVGWGDLRWNFALKALTLSHETKGTLPLASLAAGTKIAAGLAIDLASRIARANPHAGSTDLLRSTPGIVMIDEVDLHLHPNWQQEIVPALQRTFPRVQFILTTHSPQVIATVESQDIRILEEDGVRTPRFAQGLRPEAVLAEVQGADPAPRGPLRDMLNDYMKEVYADRGTAERALRLRSEINSRMGGVSLNPELSETDAYLAFSSLED